MAAKVLDDHAHDRFERRLLLLAVVRPDGAKLGCCGSIETRIETEEVFEAFAGERIAFHIKIDIAIIGCRQERKATTARDGKNLKAVLAGFARFQLQSRLC